MHIEQYSRVKVIHIRQDLEYTIMEHPAEIGDVGYVVEIYSVHGLKEGYEVECVLEDGTTRWLAVFYREEIEPYGRQFTMKDKKPQGG